jgi:hypothetical protein
MRSQGLSQEIALKRARDPEFFHRLPEPLQPRPKNHRPELVDQEINRSITLMLQQANVNHEPKDIRREKCHLFLKIAAAVSPSQPEVHISKEDRIRVGRLVFESFYVQFKIRQTIIGAVSAAQTAAEAVLILRDMILPYLREPVPCTPRFRWSQHPRVVTSLMRIVPFQRRQEPCGGNFWAKVHRTLMSAFPSLRDQLVHVAPKSVETFYRTQLQ